MTDRQLPSMPVATGVSNVELRRMAVDMAAALEERRRRFSKWVAIGLGGLAAMVPVAAAVAIQAPVALWPLFAFVGISCGISVAFASTLTMTIWGELGSRVHFHRQARRLGLGLVDAEWAFQSARQAADDDERTEARARQTNQPKMLFERRHNTD
jgi:hypothetical protein